MVVILYPWVGWRVQAQLSRALIDGWQLDRFHAAEQGAFAVSLGPNSHPASRAQRA